MKISNNHPGFCEKWRNQYPLLLLSFKDVEGLTFDRAYAMLAGLISEICIQYSFLEKENSVNAADKAVFHRLMFKESGLGRSREEGEEEIKNSLKTIMRILYTVYGRQVILLIDEYDVPLAKAKENGYYREMLDMIRGIMSTSLKGNDYLKFIIMRLWLVFLLVVDMFLNQTGKEVLAVRMWK